MVGKVLPHVLVPDTAQMSHVRKWHVLPFPTKVHSEGLALRVRRWPPCPSVAVLPCLRESSHLGPHQSLGCRTPQNEFRGQTDLKAELPLGIIRVQYPGKEGYLHGQQLSGPKAVYF
jgi:hypothetical protein